MAQGEGGIPKWLWGCGVGCLIFLVIVIAAIVGIYFLAKQGMEMAMDTMRPEALAQCEAARNAEGLSDAVREQAGRLCAIADRPDLSFMGMSMVTIALTVVEDEGVGEADRIELLTAVVAFLEENPSPGLIEVGEFMDRHSEIVERLDFDPSQSSPPLEPEVAPEPSPT